MKAASRAALALLLAAGAAGAEETVTIDAFSIWTATGAVVGTGPASHAFAGSLSGPYFIDAGQGPAPAGEIVCVGTLEADETTGAETGSARCVLRAADGARAWGRFDCAGFRLVGCKGEFEITGGEGRLEGVTAKGPIMLRRYGGSIGVGGSGPVTEEAVGVASWKGLKLTLAPKAE